MKGKRLTAYDVIGLPLGTKVIVNRIGRAWKKEELRESIETVESVISLGEPTIATRDEEGFWKRVFSEKETIKMCCETEYYEYVEGNLTNEETI
jgi:hypothetical protein